MSSISLNNFDFIKIKRFWINWVLMEILLLILTINWLSHERIIRPLDIL